MVMKREVDGGVAVRYVGVNALQFVPSENSEMMNNNSNGKPERCMNEIKTEGCEGEGLK
jgi:hypothetical protein